MTKTRPMEKRERPFYSAPRRAPFVAQLPLLLGLLAMLLFAPAVSAQIVVDAVYDAPDVLPGDGICDADVSDGFACTLRAALEENDALGGGYVVSLPASLTAFKLDPLLPGLSIATDVEIEGLANIPVLVDGLDTPGRSIFSVSARVPWCAFITLRSPAELRMRAAGY